MRVVRTIILALAGLALLLAAAPAGAATKSCKPGKYLLVEPDKFPVVAKLRARNLPRRTDGYAPPCLVAEAVAARIQDDWGRRPPRVVRPRGARWNGGRWRCRYRQRTSDGATYQATSCRKGRQRVTMNLGS